jgi:heptosyltransferase III
MAGWIKKNFPGAKVIFLGRTYTRDVVALSAHVDECVDFSELEKLDENKQIEFLKKFLNNLNADAIVHVFPHKHVAALAKKSGIGLRVGTTNRLWHWFTCNKLIKLSRKNSDLHESQLNLKLLGFLSGNVDLGLAEIPAYYGFTSLPQLDSEFAGLIDPKKFNLILHPKSKGSAKEWGIGNFKKLVTMLPADKYQVFISGTAGEGKLMPELLKETNVIDMTGKFSLAQFIAFISRCDGMVAASTGPLHIAAALGKKAIGLFSPRRPIHPGRWKPVGPDAHAIVAGENCVQCSRKADCDCIMQIEPKQIVDLLIQHAKVQR